MRDHSAISVREQLEGWRSRSQNLLWEEFRETLTDAAQLVIDGTNFRLEVVDDTNAAGAHSTVTFVEPHLGKSTPVLAVRGMEGVVLPTFCHLVEVVAMISAMCEIPLQQSLTGEVDSRASPTLRVPLLVDPPRTNAAIFHTQVRHISPISFLQGWSRLVDLLAPAEQLELRHTMLLWPRSSNSATINPFFEGDQPMNRDYVNVKILERGVALNTSRFRLLHLGRISRDWSHPGRPAKASRVNLANEEFVIDLAGIGKHNDLYE